MERAPEEKRKVEEQARVDASTDLKRRKAESLEKLAMAAVQTNVILVKVLSNRLIFLPCSDTCCFRKASCYHCPALHGITIPLEKPNRVSSFLLPQLISVSNKYIPPPPQ